MENTLDIYTSNKTYNKNIKNIHVLRTITYHAHSPPSYVASSSDARTAYATTEHDITSSIPMATLSGAYNAYTQQYKIHAPHTHVVHKHHDACNPVHVHPTAYTPRRMGCMYVQWV